MVQFQVYGVPRGAGSKRPWPIKKNGIYTGKFGMSDSSGEHGREWRALVTDAAFQAMRESELPPFNEALFLRAEFFMPRPKSHYGSGRNNGCLKNNSPTAHTHAPDVLKMGRLIEDAMTHIVYADDSLIVEESLSKRYHEQPGCRVLICPWSEVEEVRVALPEFALTDARA